ncbi:MAG: hypothetical protein IIA88_08170 [Bacteroidetes bacterium]|nr:hypothetical protein [Bacteroidota bacterium]
MSTIIKSFASRMHKTQSAIRHALCAILLIVFVFSIYSCGSGTSDEDKFDKGIKFDDASEKLKADVEKVVYSLPSPIQVTSLIKNSGASYMGELLNGTTHVDKYFSSNYKSALNMGIYGADLGYACIYYKTQDAISFLKASKKLADQLGILGAFDLDVIERFERNLDNRDSLIRVVTESFRMTDGYLKENARNSIGALIITGSWIEGLFVASATIENYPQEIPEEQRMIILKPIINRVAEQQKPLSNLIMLLSSFGDEQNIPEILSELKELQKTFDAVKSTESYAAPTTNAETGVTTINTTSTIDISLETLAKIGKKIKAIRTEIVSYEE